MDLTLEFAMIPVWGLVGGLIFFYTQHALWKDIENVMEEDP